MVKASLPTSGVILGIEVPVPEGRHDTSVRAFDRALYRNLLPPRKYKAVQENQDYHTVTGVMKWFCKYLLRPYEPGKNHGRIYDGLGTPEMLTRKRDGFVKLAREYDLSHPQEMWSVLVQQIEQPIMYAQFYTTLEELLVEHLEGRFVIEIFVNGNVRIIKRNKVVSIFHLSAAGVAQYRDMMSHPFSTVDSKQTLYTFMTLVLNRGLMFTPGPKFLSAKERNWCDGEGSGWNGGYKMKKLNIDGAKRIYNGIMKQDYTGWQEYAYNRAVIYSISKEIYVEHRKDTNNCVLRGPEYGYAGTPISSAEFTEDYKYLGLILETTKVWVMIE